MSLKFQFSFLSVCGTHVSTKIVRIATLSEFHVIDRFFTTSCDLNMGQLLDFFHHILHEKGHKAWFLRKMPEVRLKHYKLLKDELFFQLCIIE
jgi:hypothetical protein